MAWTVEHICSNKDRCATAVRDDLATAAEGDKTGGRGYNSVASAIEAALGAFGNLNGYSVEIKTIGDIKADGQGYLSISIRTIEPGVIVS